MLITFQNRIDAIDLDEEYESDEDTAAGEANKIQSNQDTDKVAEGSAKMSWLLQIALEHLGIIINNLKVCSFRFV